MTTSKWNLNVSESDFMVREKKSVIAYMDAAFEELSSSIAIENNQLTNAKLDFVLDVNRKNSQVVSVGKTFNSYLSSTANPIVTFKTISFEAINSDINFVKGYLTMNNITKVVELDAKIVKEYAPNNTAKVVLEINGEINRNDFDLVPDAAGKLRGYPLQVMANLEFTNYLN